MSKFKKGWAGGPGRPPGSRNKSTVVLDAIGLEGVEDTVRMVKRLAVEEESLGAANILLNRVWPRTRGRAVEFDLPPVTTAEGIIQGHAALLAAVAAGTITPEEATLLSGLLENQRRSLETYDHEKRLQAWEAEKAGRS